MPPCGLGLDGPAPAAPEWAQVVDVQVTRTVTEWVLPGLLCPCCETVAVAPAIWRTPGLRRHAELVNLWPGGGVQS